MKPVVFHRDAEAELEAAVAWYENQRDGLGRDLREIIELAAAQIRQHPTRFSKYRQTAVRKCRVKRFPYSVYYIEFEEVIWIAAVAHDKRRPDYWASRQPEDG
jgi:toxin ParE1/3/4